MLSEADTAERSVSISISAGAAAMPETLPKTFKLDKLAIFDKVIPESFSLRVSELISIPALSTWTASTPLEDVSPSPASPVATLSLIIEPSTAPSAIVNEPPAAMEASPLTFAKIESSRFEKLTFFSVPLSDTIK